MEAIKYKVLNSKGQEVGTIDLDPEVFGGEVNETVAHTAIVWQRNKKRAGTHSCLTKGEMRGGNKKPWRQKGTGRARSGSNTSPLWVGGAVAHGPHPHDYISRVSKRTRRQAMIAVLSDKVNRQLLVVVDKLGVESGKSKDMKSVLKNIGAPKGAALVFAGSKKEARLSKDWLASRNLVGVEPMTIDGVNPYDLLRLNFLVSTVDGVNALQALVKARGESAE